MHHTSPASKAPRKPYVRRMPSIWWLPIAFVLGCQRAAPPPSASAPSASEARFAPELAAPTAPPSGPAPGAGGNEALPAVRPMRLGADADPAALGAQAQEAFAKRSELTELKLAISRWERLHGLEPDNAAVALQLSRAYFLLGDSFYRPTADAAPGIMHDAFERGTLAGEQALMGLSPAFAAQLAAGKSVEEALEACGPEALEAMAWYAQNLTAFALARGIPTMLLYRKRVQTLVEQMILRDERVQYGAAYRVRGSFYAQAPSFAGGSLALAQAAFARAQLLAPNYLPNALASAEHWAVQAADKKAFVQTLAPLAQADVTKPPDVDAEQMLAQKRAAWLLTQVNRLF